MKIIIDHATDPSHLKVKICLVHCLDPRFKEAHDLFKKSYEIVDAISLAGGAKWLATPSSPGHEFVLGQIADVVKAHNVPEVALMVHENCAMYKGNLDGVQDEHEFLCAELINAKENVTRFLAERSIENVPVNIYLVTLDGIKKIEEPVFN